jgi:hypothetical protein
MIHAVNIREGMFWNQYPGTRVEKITKCGAESLLIGVGVGLK